METGRNFLKWGGFYDLQPIESTRPITDEELFCGSTLDHVRMRRTLRYWAEATGDRNPFEILHKGEPVKDAAEDISIPPTSRPRPTDVQETEIPQSTIPSSVEAVSSLSEPSENISADVAARDVSHPLESTAGLHTTQDLAADMLQTSPPSSSQDVYSLEFVSEEEPRSQKDETDDFTPSPPAAASKK